MRRGRVPRQFRAHLMVARRAGGAPAGWLFPGRPWLELQGFGLAPGSAQSPPGSRPIESGFLGERGPGRGGSSGSSSRRYFDGGVPATERGCGVASAARPLGRRRLQCYSYYCTSLRYISFQNSTPRTHNSLRLKGAAETTRRGMEGA